MIRLANIGKRYDLGEVQVTALEGVSLTIERGEYLSVMGPSGSGKSTLLHIVGLLDVASEGSYFLEQVGLAERRYHLPAMLSGGEQQRVAVARSLALEPDLILADEPTGNLPSDRGAEIMALLEGLNRSGVTLVMVTHDATLGRRARRRVRLRDGRIAEDRPLAAAPTAP